MADLRCVVVELFLKVPCYELHIVMSRLCSLTLNGLVFGSRLSRSKLPMSQPEEHIGTTWIPGKFVACTQHQRKSNAVYSTLYPNAM